MPLPSVLFLGAVHSLCLFLQVIIAPLRSVAWHALVSLSLWVYFGNWFRSCKVFVAFFFPLTESTR